MLLKRYSVPVILGVCLGVIMTGVQISATALDAVINAGESTAGIVVVERVDGGGLKGSFLGEEFSVSIPRKAGLTACAHEANEKAGDIFRQACQSGISCLESIHSLYKETCAALTGLFKENIYAKP